MKHYMLDTNIVSYFIKGANASLHRRMLQATKDQNIAISAVTRAEIRYGQALMAANDKRQTPIELFLAEVPTLPWTDVVADYYGKIKATLKRQGAPTGELDTQIAAHALAKNLILVTHNTKHFKNMDKLKLEDWVV